MMTPAATPIYCKNRLSDHASRGRIIKNKSMGFQTTMVLLRVGFMLVTFSLVQCLLTHQTPIRRKGRQLAPPLLASSDGSGSEELDAMRRMLEVSWNADTMGEVPSNPEAAANEAYGSIMSATEDGKNLFFIDLLLPSYEKGERLYDEVLAVEYCIALSSCLKGKSEILVRDEKTLKTVGRVLDARERNDANTKEDEEDSTNDDEDADQLTASEDYNIDTKFSAESPSKDPADVDAFRQKLMSDWDSAGSDSEVSRDIPEEELIPAKEPKRERAPKKIQTTNKSYRLTSMFGDEIISKGSDMPGSVIRAVQLHGLPDDDEENIIILNGISREEMVAIRSLVDAYEASKNIIMINCRLDPMPRELLMAETVYSILPLIAKPTSSGSTGNVGTTSDTLTSPKVVVLRRYPRDWEIYVDMGRGFELAKKTDSRPSPAQTADSVKQFLESNSNQ